MAKSKIINPYGGLQLPQQIYMECRAMAEYALAKGQPVSPRAVTTIQTFTDEAPGEGMLGDESIPTPRPKKDLFALVSVHQELSRLVQPATPQTILLLDMEQESDRRFKFLGPVGLVRQMMIAALLSLVIFVGVVLSPSINGQGGNIFTMSGFTLLLTLLFYLSAAGLGAAFSGLYKANQFITAGVFDPAHQASYWIRFFLGLISGLLLAIVISEKAMAGNDFLEDGVVRPLLAIVGGFSADLLYTFLNRMVETLKSIFQGSAQQQVEAKTQAAQARLNGDLERTKLGFQKELVNFQQDLGADLDPEVKEKLSALMSKIGA